MNKMDWNKSSNPSRADGKYCVEEVMLLAAAAIII